MKKVTDVEEVFNKLTVNNKNPLIVNGLNVIYQ